MSGIEGRSDLEGLEDQIRRGDETGLDEAGPSTDELQECMLGKDLGPTLAENSGPHHRKSTVGEYEFSRRYVIRAMVIGTIVIISVLGLVFFFSSYQH